MVKCILTIIIGYLLGSISMAIILTRAFFNDDVRNHGSGNAGATNVARNYGWIAGIATLVADFLKCIISYAVGSALYGPTGAALGIIACVTGHCFPIYFKFKGGKAISVGAAVALLVSWKLFLILAVIFFSIVIATRYVSLGSITVAAVLVVGAAFFNTQPLMIFAGIYTGILAIYMHRSNIKRLLKGEETKFRAGKRNVK